MVACLEKTNENAEFHQIVDFLSTCSINYALAAHEGEGLAIPTEPQPIPSTTQSNISATQTAPLQTATHPTVSHEPQTKTHIKQILPSSSIYQRKHKKTHKPRKATKVTKLPQNSMPLDIGADEEIGSGDRPTRQATTLGGADAQTRFEIASKRSSDLPLLTCHTVGSGKDMMEQETDLTNFVPPTPYDSPLSRGHTPGSDEGRPNFNELMNLCTQLSNRVLALEQFKTTQNLVIKRLQKKVKRLEKKQRARTLGMKLFKIGTSKKRTLDKENVYKHERVESNRIEELNLSDKGSVNDASVIPNVSTAGPSTSTAEDIFEDKMTTMADILMAIRRTRPRTTSVVIHDVEEEQRRATPPLIARIDANALLAERLQQKEKEQFTVDEQAKMLVDLIAERKRFFTAQRAEQIRNKPPTKAQLRNKMKLEEDDAEKEELRACLDIVPLDDIAIDVESLATKYPIVNWKTHTLTEHVMYYQIIRANGSSKNYKILTEMCDGFDRQDIMDLYKLVKERYESTSPERYDLLLWGDLTTLFELSEEDVIWKAQHDYNLIRWRQAQNPLDWTVHRYSSFPLWGYVGNKMYKAFPLLGESSHWQYKFPLPVEGVPSASRMEIPLPRVCTAMMKKLPVKENWQ
nr:hypothetical protein [Tanacetum cinerariifolium]